MSSYKKPGYHTLYRATFPNGKVYIGITSQYLVNRIWRHTAPSQNKKNRKRPMYNALKKYNGSVVWDTILTFDKLEDCKQAEISFIEFYNSTNPEKGYNISKGGDSCFGIKRPNLHKKLIDNSGNVFDGYQSAMDYYSLTRAQIKGSVKQGNSCGHVYFSYYKNGMIKALPRTLSNKYRRKVIDHVNGIIFFSVTDTCIHHNITQAELATFCKKKNTPKFSYYEEIKCQG